MLPATPRQDSAKGAFYSVVVSPDQKFILAGNRAGKVHVWDAVTGTHLRSFDAHADAVSDMRFLKDGRLLTASWDGRLRVWNWRLGDSGASAALTMLEVPRQLFSVALSADGTSAYVSTENGDIYRVALAEERHPLARAMMPGASNGSIEGAGKGFVASRGNEFVTAQLKDGQEGAKTQTSLVPGPIKAMARAREAGLVFAAIKDAVFVSDGQTAKLAALQGIDLGIGEIQSIAVSDDASLLVMLKQITQPTIRSQLQIWAIDKSAQRSKPCPQVTFPSRTTRLAAFRPGTREFVTVDAAGLLFWRVRSQGDCPAIEPIEARVPDDVPSNEIRAIAFNPQGDTLWAANFSGRIFSFPLQGDQKVKTWKMDATSVPTRLAVSRAGDIAVGDETGRLYVIRPDKRMPLQIVQKFHNSTIDSLDISPDGDWLLSAGANGLALWSLGVNTWIEKACALAKRKDFTPDETRDLFSNQASAPHSCSRP